MKPHIPRKSAPRLEALEGRALLSTAGGGPVYPVESPGMGFVKVATAYTTSSGSERPQESLSLNFVAVSPVGSGARPQGALPCGVVWMSNIFFGAAPAQGAATASPSGDAHVEWIEL